MLIDLTKEERDACLTQIGCRLDELKKLTVEAKDFNRIEELTTFIKPIQSAFNKMLSAK